MNKNIHLQLCQFDIKLPTTELTISCDILIFDVTIKKKKQ